jgi:hypothetical protein
MLLDGCCLCLLAPFCWRRPIRPRGIHAFLYEIARCLLSKQAKSAGPQWTTLLCFPHCSHLFLTCREPGVPLSLFRPYPLPFSPTFLLYCSLPFLFFYVFFIDLYLL